MAQVLDGKALATKIQSDLATDIPIWQQQWGRAPGLAVVMVGDHPASAAYVRNKERACQRVGITSYGQHLPLTTTQAELSHLIAQLNQDERVDGVLLQLPLPRHLNEIELLNQVDPNKDVDGLHPINLGRLVRGEAGLRSCTPAGVMALLRAYDIATEGKRAIVIGRSILVGKPMALMLIAANATVTIAHSHTQDLTALIQQADILIAAVGRPHMIKMVKTDAVVIDVGINRVEDPRTGQFKLVGDVDFQAVAPLAQAITPVPGGIGPMTVAMLLHNTAMSYRQRFGLGSRDI